MLRANAFVRTIDNDRLAVDDLCGASENRDLALPEKTGDPRGQPVHDPVLPADRPGEIERGRSHGQPEWRSCRAKPGVVIGFRCVDQSLRRDAADIEAGAAEAVLLDEHGRDAELTGPDRRNIPSWPTA